MVHTYNDRDLKRAMIWARLGEWYFRNEQSRKRSSLTLVLGPASLNTILHAARL